MRHDPKPIIDLLNDYMKRHWPALTWHYSNDSDVAIVMLDAKAIADIDVGEIAWPRIQIDLPLQLDRKIIAAYTPPATAPLAEFMRRYERIDAFLRKGNEAATISFPKAPTNEMVELTVESAASRAIDIVHERARKTHLIDGYVRRSTRKFEPGKSDEIQRANNNFAYLCAIGNAMAVKFVETADQKAA